MIHIDGIDVWTTRLDVADARLTKCFDLLSPEERERAQRFKFEKDRRRWVAARAWLREVLGDRTGRPPNSLVFSYTALGKPSLPGEPVAFSLSHSRDFAALAISKGRPEIGIDIEFIDNAFEWHSVAAHAFSQHENTALLALPQTAKFYEIWTRKEAYLKARGCGLSEPTGRFSVWPHSSLDPDWTIEPMNLRKGFAAALCFRR